MHHLTKVRLIQDLNEQELRHGIKLSGSWHQKVNISLLSYIIIYLIFHYLLLILILSLTKYLRNKQI